MLTGMGLAAVACAVFAVAPILVGPALKHVLTALPTVGGQAAGPALGAYLRLPGIAGSMSRGRFDHLQDAVHGHVIRRAPATRL